MKNNKIKSRSAVTVVLGLMLTFYVLFLFVLILWGFFTSVKSYHPHTATNPLNVFRGNEIGLPKGHIWQWEWKNYTKVLDYIYAYVYFGGSKYKVNVVQMLENTLFYTVGGALISTMLPCIVAYATSKTNFKFSKIFDATILVVMIIPIIGAYPSELQILNTLKIYNTWIGYFVQRMHCISVYYLIFQAAFRSIPASYSEAAMVEGANRYTIMFRICIPLVRTMIFTVFLIYFIEIWNNYNTSLLYMPSHPSFAYGIFYLVFENAETHIDLITYKMAGSFVLFIPILILFILFRKPLMQNLSMGGLKE